MKKAILMVVIVFSWMLGQTQDTIIMKNGKIYTGKIQVRGNEYYQIVTNDAATMLPISGIKTIKSGSNPFRWDVVTELKGTKKELYDKATIVIADAFVNSNVVTRISDIDKGIVVKGKVKGKSFGMGGYYKPLYGFTLKMQFKDGKYKILIYDPECEVNGISIPITENFTGGYAMEGVSKKKHIELMEMLTYEMKSLIERIKTEMSKQQNNDDW